MSALNELETFYRGRVNQQLKPKRSHLLSSGHQLLMTNAGPLDLLGSIGSGHTYKDLLKHTVELEAGGLHLRMLDLEKLIEIKKETITDKDKIMLPLLQHILEMKKNQ